MEKTEFMKQCMEAGKSEEACSLEWAEKQGDTKTDAALMQENEMLKAQLKVREDQLKQAIAIANKANDQQKARDEAEKADLINRIVVDTAGKITKDELADKPLRELVLIKTYTSKSLDSTFASIAALQAEKDKAKTFGIDYWDSKAQEWRIK